MYFHDLETEKYQSSSNTYQRDKNTHIALKSPLSDYLVMWAGKIYDSKTVRWFFLFWVSTFLQLARPINLSTTETRTDENVHVFRNIEDRAPKIHIIIKCNSIRKNNYTLQRFSRWKAWQKENSAFIPPPPRRYMYVPEFKSSKGSSEWHTPQIACTFERKKTTSKNKKLKLDCMKL